MEAICKTIHIYLLSEPRDMFKEMYLTLKQEHFKNAMTLNHLIYQILKLAPNVGPYQKRVFFYNSYL